MQLPSPALGARSLSLLRRPHFVISRSDRQPDQLTRLSLSPSLGDSQSNAVAAMQRRADGQTLERVENRDRRNGMDGGGGVAFGGGVSGTRRNYASYERSELKVQPCSLHARPLKCEGNGNF